MDRARIRSLQTKEVVLNMASQIAGVYTMVSPYVDGIYAGNEPLSHIVQNNQLGLPQAVIGAIVALYGFSRIREADDGGMEQIIQNVGLPEEHMQLVTENEYGQIRNPRYLGHRLVTTGAFLINPTWHGALGLVLHHGLCELGVRREEEVNEEIFGDEYRDYKERVPRWIPRDVSDKARKVGTKAREISVKGINAFRRAA